MPVDTEIQNVTSTGLDSDDILKELTPTEELPVEDNETEVSEGKENEDQEDENDSKDEDKETEVEKVPEDLASDGIQLKAMTDKYPNLLKEFPQLKGLVESNSKYREVFPTIEDAQEAVEKVENYNFLEEQLLSGKAENFSNFLGSIKSTSAKAFENMASNFLPTLFKLDETLYLETTAPLFQNLLRSVYSNATKNGNENLKGSALHLAKFLFDDHRVASGEVSAVRERNPEVESEREKFENEKKEFEGSKFQEFRTEVIGAYTIKLESMITDGLDPNKTLSDFDRKNVIRDIVERLTQKLVADSQHQATMTSLWKKAQANRSSEARQRLLALQVSKVRQLLPGVRQQVLQEATKGKVKLQGLPSGKQRTASAGNTGGGSKNGAVPSSQEIDWSKTSSADFLNGKIAKKG